ncbi:MAG: HNH endonuclease [Desulfurellaceae bacterium]|nr:HNH endonuclease [Desulfurellaceae bacterium]
MRIEWPGNRCIICLKEAPLSREHLIPKALGGIFTCSFLCKECNSALGARVDIEVKKDPRIRFAVDNLESDISKLAYKFREGQNVLLHGSSWTEPGKVHKGIPQVTSRKTEDGALIQSPDESYKSNEKILRKNGINEDTIQEGLRRLYEAKENEIVELAPGRIAVKRRVEQVEPDPRGSKLLTPLFPLKIGYEFLALLLGTAIYKQDPALDRLRVALRQGLENHPSFHVESLNASEYKPFHGIGFVGNNPHAVVLIRLFGWLAFRVHFHRLTINHPSISYLHRLDTNQEDIQATNQSADTPRQSG